jgi:hypothetical protein
MKAKNINAYRASVGKLGGKKPPARIRRTWEENIKIGLQ